MPEPYRPKRGLEPYMLSAAVKNGNLAEARCGGCSPPRWYDIGDLLKLYGDIPAINLEAVMPCETCGQRGMRVNVTSPIAADRQKIRVRRLDRVWWVRKTKWVEER